MPWRMEWLSTPVFLPGEIHGQSILVGYIVHGVTKWLSDFHIHFQTVLKAIWVWNEWGCPSSARQLCSLTSGPSDPFAAPPPSILLSRSSALLLSLSFSLPSPFFFPLYFSEQICFCRKLKWYELNNLLILKFFFPLLTNILKYLNKLVYWN